MSSLHEDLNRFVDHLELSPEEREAHVRRLGVYITARFVSIDRAADAAVAARHDELDQVTTFVQDEYTNSTPFKPELVLRFIERRRAEVDALSNREPD